MSMGKQKIFISLIRLPQPSDSFKGILCPCIQIRPAPLVIQIALYDPAEVSLTVSAFLIPADIFLNYDFFFFFS